MALRSGVNRRGSLDHYSEIGLGDPGIFTIPSLSDFPPTRSDDSLRSKNYLEPDRDQNENEEPPSGTTMASVTQKIDTIPDSGYIHTYLFNGNWYKTFRSLFLVSDHSVIHRLAYRSPVSVFVERSRHLASFPNIIHPYSTFRWYWDILMTLFLFVTLILDPIRMTFYGQSFLDGSIEHIQWSIVVTVMYTIDIILNFRTGRVDSETDLVILDPNLIVASYMKSWFFVDLLSTIPFDLIFILYMKILRVPGPISENEIAYSELMRILDLFKVFRLTRAVRYISRLLVAYKIQGMHVRFIGYLLTSALLSHWLACLHYLIPDISNGEQEVKSPKSWVTKAELWNASVGEKYLNSYYRSLTHLVSFGIGSISPTEPQEILCSIVNLLFGLVLFAFFIGHISSILLSKGVPERKYVEVINQVKEFLRFKQVPKELQRRILLFYEVRYQRNYFSEEHILSSISDVLRKELLMHNCSQLVQSVPIFHGLSSNVIYSIVGKLQFQVYLPRDIIVPIKTIGTTMYFIEHGMVSILAENGRVIGHLKDGDFFGELALISTEKRVATVIATSQVNAYLLSKEDFNKAMKGFPEIRERILRIAHERINKVRLIADLIRANDEQAKKAIVEELAELARARGISRSSSESSISTINTNA